MKKQYMNPMMMMIDILDDIKTEDAITSSNGGNGFEVDLGQNGQV